MKTPCKECFLKGCDCTCTTCIAVRGRNTRLTRLELTRLSVIAGLAEAKANGKTIQRVGRMLRKVGL